MTSTDFSLSTDVAELSSVGSDLSTIAQIVLYERQARDWGWWAQMAATYWPGAIVNLMWYHGDAAGFISGSKRLYEGGARPFHHMFAPVVHVSGTRAHAEAAASTWSRWNIDGTDCTLNTYMKLNYRFERRDGVWRIAQFDCVYEYGTLTPVVPGESVVIPATELAAFRDSYAIMAWHQTRRGVAVDNDQLGVDRPEQLADFYASTSRWLHGA
ncbi:nuclear transport factor 2 family protein [Subtercola lobariae]|uniref:SnoaL-like domain-containing protein n=1 Tax=Subtercola lobariae TaxID=1588641 RepID=A0A917BAC7_9MICO|nr:nuclear transport factor 2 family protein [Subtercola lobariae]GGF30839.1 hypothetical protein GCM10011399_25140 [Subtercola lobariae]